MGTETPDPPPVLVAGSCNYDLTVRTDGYPRASETVLGGDYRAYPGGKGANQALGLQRLGTPVRLLSAVGDDHFGRQILDHLRREGLDTGWIQKTPGAPTGLALITVDRSGSRSIVVAPGAGSTLDRARAEAFLRDARPGLLLLLQLEIPPEIVGVLLRRARRQDLRTVLHASPAVDLPPDLLRLTDLVLLNQRELGQLSGSPARHLQTAGAAAQKLLDRGASTVVVTLGQRGALLVSRPGAWPGLEREQEQGRLFVPGFKLPVVDSNAASSAFVAGLVHRLAGPDPSLSQAARHGLAAMALSLSREGGQASLPRGEEVRRLLEAEQAAPAAPDGELARRARSIRRRIIRMLYAARSGHPGGSLSVVEVLTVLYFEAMTYNARQPAWPERDRLVLSKGHAAPALYSTLMEAGVLDPALETELRKLGSPLQGHPDLKRCPGVEMSTGSLGQGLSVANGLALAARHTGRGYRVYCILGDGELEEGQVWEAAMTAAHQRLDNLCAVLDYNALQIDGSIAHVKAPIEPLADKWLAFGWNVISVDGHDLAELRDAFCRARACSGRPSLVLAHTIKGRGVSFMEGVIEYHGSTLGEQEVARALLELGVEP
jgi:transketolase